MDLKLLKMQIHPHFLFNSLNTIYGFALRKAEETPELILKLSNLLDYILYQVNKPKVSLKEEVLHIEEYIELEKIRFQERMEVVFETSEIDEITLSHNAKNRLGFAQGAVVAAEWVAHKKGVFKMNDLLNF